MYPLIGMVVRLAWQTLQRRVAQVKHPPVVPPSCSSCFWGMVASLSFSLITCIGVLPLGAQPEVWRLSVDPLSPAFWQFHDCPSGPA